MCCKCYQPGGVTGNSYSCTVLQHTGCADLENAPLSDTASQAFNMLPTHCSLGLRGMKSVSEVYLVA